MEKAQKGADMSDLISRCELFNRLAPVQTLGEAYGIIQEMPTVDAVPVVRCRECIFWDKDHISCEGLAKCCTGEGGIRYRNRSDFCSRGEREEQ